MGIAAIAEQIKADAAAAKVSNIAEARTRRKAEGQK
jgi:hypothetical protein